MTVKEYFEKYWFLNSNEEVDTHGYDMPIVKCKDGTLLVCSIIVKLGYSIGYTDWIDEARYFYCLISNIYTLDDNVYNYIPDYIPVLCEPVDIGKLEEEATKHGGVTVDPEILKYSFISKVFSTFEMTADLFDIVEQILK